MPLYSNQIPLYCDPMPLLLKTDANVFQFDNNAFQSDKNVFWSNHNAMLIAHGIVIGPLRNNGSVVYMGMFSGAFLPMTNQGDCELLYSRGSAEPVEP